MAKSLDEDQKKGAKNVFGWEPVEANQLMHKISIWEWDKDRHWQSVGE